MNTRRHALGSFHHAKDRELFSAANTILKAMKDNPYFTNPNVPIAAFRSALKEYEKYLGLATQTQSVLDIAARNDARKVVEALIKKLAFYVNDTANGELEKLHSSGFVLSNGASRRQFPDIVSNVRLRDGKHSGSLKLDFSKQQQIPLYEYRYAQRADKDVSPLDWSEAFLSSSTRITISDLNPLTHCYVQVRALNGEGRSEWSEPVSHIIR